MPNWRGLYEISTFRKSSSTQTGIPRFRKSVLYHTTFTEDLHQYLFLLTKRNLKRIFTFTKKGEKQKQHSASVLQRAIIEAARNPSRESGTAKLLPQELDPAFQHQAAIALKCVCEHYIFYLDLFCASVSRKMCPKVTTSLLYTISVYKIFHSNTLLLESEGNLYRKPLEYLKFIF